ncbi:acetoacetate--CoA ligase [Haliangium sp.]|uniref:acetoacetate--CoA ligase n=1 Tax=Haliangium sp. TaxID=2663208 RepID=UPI003D14BA78
MSEPLWQPSDERIARANLTAFMQRVEADWGVSVGDYASLYAWSIEHIDRFWSSMWDFAGVVGERGSGPVVVAPERMPGARFFPEAKLNFAENLLAGAGDGDAIVFRGEDGRVSRLSRDQLRARVAGLARALAGDGVGPGDRVAGFMPNLPETVIGMLAVASLGAVWSSCSPDFGVRGVLDRFGQIEPKVLLCADGYHYAGKAIGSLARVAEFSRALPSLERVVVVGYLDPTPALDELAGLPATRMSEYAPAGPGADIAFARLGFDHPLYIMYSSGTTGKPKCIVHGAGGTLLQHLKEHQLLCDVRPGDRVFYFTTCGWMMWNWLVSGLASGATLLLYDGSPAHPNLDVLFDFVDGEGGTLFGTSAKFIDALAKAERRPGQAFGLQALRAITSTGSPLSPEGFDFVYEHIKADVCLSSISGGTDIIGCFVGGNPIGPVYRGEIQARCLGMAVEVWDDAGQPVREQKGELVCTRPFPSMPVGFWNDPDQARYRGAYFERFPGVWCHGDFAELTEHDGMIIYGRSDATLNPGGVRIGTAEIYRQVEQLPEVQESIVIGQDWDGDVRVVLFVKLRPGSELDDALVGRIKQKIRAGASPRHVPAKVLAVADIPRTKSGKITELAVREVVHGRVIKNREALANPEALEYFRDRAELAT